MGESVDGQVIAHCHQCGTPCDVHSNCANDLCHLLFIQCRECAEKYEHCCSAECRSQKNISEEEKLNIRNMGNFKFGNRSVYRKSFRLAGTTGMATSMSPK
jgi:UPF0176 protein